MRILDCGFGKQMSEVFDCGFWHADCGLLERSAEGMAHGVKG
ncbi:hypothetical protein D1AOALGA4SA_9897 [Olavius algarvensis Delta 1 endosymbiont]|nr:hypothetical protein D1AOALGA4SA_9897 [Olavius algarvensis Delta 1 endosymbiont]